MHVHSSLIPNSQKKEITPIVSRWMGKQNVVHPCYIILFSHKKVLIDTMTWINLENSILNEAQDKRLHAVWLLTWNTEQRQIQRQKATGLMVSRARGRENREWLGFLSGVMKMFWDEIVMLVPWIHYKSPNYIHFKEWNFVICESYLQAVLADRPFLVCVYLRIPLCLS